MIVACRYAEWDLLWPGRKGCLHLVIDVCEGLLRQSLSRPAGFIQASIFWWQCWLLEKPVHSRRRAQLGYMFHALPKWCVNNKMTTFISYIVDSLMALYSFPKIDAWYISHVIHQRVLYPRISFVKININVNVLKYVIKNLKQAPTPDVFYAIKHISKNVSPPPSPPR